MSTPPGSVVTVGVKPSARSTPTDTGPAFWAILTDRAPTLPKRIESIDEWPGSRQTWSVDYDTADHYFRAGGDVLYLSAVVGPAGAAATLNIPGTSGTGIVVTARDKGEFGNGAAGGFTAQVANGTSGGSYRKLTIQFNNETIAEVDDYQTNQAAVDALMDDLGSDGDVIVTIGGGSGLTPVMAETNLAGGTIDRLNVATATHLPVALAKFTSTYGPGQEAAPNFQSDAAHSALLASAANHNRFAVLDPIDTTSKSTLEDAAEALYAGANADCGALYAPWLEIPPLAAGGSNRSVPPSGLVCAKMAVNDAVPGDGPAQSPMADWGVDPFALDVKATFSRDTISGVNDAGDLNDAGVNLIILDEGLVTVYGMRTLVNQAGAYKIWGQVGTVRHRMSITARGAAKGKRYVGAKLNKRSVEKFEVDLNGMLLTDYRNGDLFADLDDDRPQTAFRVDVDTPNTPENIAAGRLGAIVYYRPVKGGEMVAIQFEAVAITDTVG